MSRGWVRISGIIALAALSIAPLCLGIWLSIVSAIHAMLSGPDPLMEIAQVTIAFVIACFICLPPLVWERKQHKNRWLHAAELTEVIAREIVGLSIPYAAAAFLFNLPQG